MSAIAWATIEDAIQAWIVAGSGYASDHVTWSQQTAPRPTGAFISMRLAAPTAHGRDWRARVDTYLTVGPLTVSAVNTGADTITITAHGLVTGDGQIRMASTGTFPSPITATTDLWAIVVDANTIKLASTFALAVAAAPTAIDLTTVGTGTITIASTATTTRAGQEVTQYVRGHRTIDLQLQAFAGAPTGGAPTGVTSPLAVLHDAITSYMLDSRSAALTAAGVAVLSFSPVRSIDGVVNTTRFEPRAFSTVVLSIASELVETSTYIQTANALNQIVTPNETVAISIP